MCRWLAYAGPPICIETLVLKPENSLIEQSKHAHESLTTTNGDGFGIGWFDTRPQPGLFRDTQPAWNDENLINMAQQVQSRLFFAHVRASSGTPTSRPNCHPFRHANWLFMHNGMISDFESVRRDLTLMIAPELFTGVQGTTDSEVLFHLMLTNGLRDDPPRAISRTLAQTRDAMRARGIDGPLRITATLTDGETLYAVRYASDGRPPSLYYGCGMQACFGDPDPALGEENAILVLSEPLDEERGRWIGVPDAHLLVAKDGMVTVAPFEVPAS